ncbi:MAG TPA: hypothetical protein V6C86_00850 [Oculatellaceae cyanobacterium]|jgi:hypothetical protein
MDSLENELFFDELGRYGYQLFRTESAEKTAHVLRKIVTSDDARILEGFPIVFSNILLDGLLTFDLVEFENSLPKAYQRRFRMLVAVSYHFIFVIPNNLEARQILSSYLKKRDPELLLTIPQVLASNTPLNIGQGIVLSPERLTNAYGRYFSHRQLEQNESISNKIEKERVELFQKAIALLFTDKQTTLLYKLLDKKPVTKTEKEYFSRTLKPRLKAICNKDLQDLATMILSRG